MTDIMIFQNIDLSSWDTLYMYIFSKERIKWILKKKGGTVWVGFICLRIGLSD
jgi:hypothetical protein